MNQWKGIEIYETDGKYLKGCSAEGHISHVYADRMSSRPRTWSDDGIDKMSRLRTFVSNGGKIYEELISNVSVKRTDSGSYYVEGITSKGDTKRLVTELSKAEAVMICIELNQCIKDANNTHVISLLY